MNTEFGQKRVFPLFDQIDDNSFEVVAVSYSLPKPQAAFPLAPITRRSKNIQTFLTHLQARRVRNFVPNLVWTQIWPNSIWPSTGHKTLQIVVLSASNIHIDPRDESARVWCKKMKSLCMNWTPIFLKNGRVHVFLSDFIFSRADRLDPIRIAKKITWSISPELVWEVLEIARQR